VGDDSFYRCTHEREISCESYDSVEDCIGSHSPYSIGGQASMFLAISKVRIVSSSSLARTR
jgi:hypothetical protein